jgi:methylated-DNA-protein-cysteine methyltransferase related protein
VTTYGLIADYLHLGASRMVGWALNNCHGEVDGIPAHRVINRKGELSGRHHFGSPTRMQELLEAEGVVVVNDCVQDFDKLLWRPSEDLKLDSDLG